MATITAPPDVLPLRRGEQPSPELTIHLLALMYQTTELSVAAQWHLEALRFLIAIAQDALKGGYHTFAVPERQRATMDRVLEAIMPQDHTAKRGDGSILAQINDLLLADVPFYDQYYHGFVRCQEHDGRISVGVLCCCDYRPVA